MVRKNKIGTVDFSAIEKLDLEKKEAILQVLQLMLVKDHKQRPKASDLLNHELFSPSMSKDSASTVGSESNVYRVHASLQPRSLTSLNNLISSPKSPVAFEDY